MNRTETSESPHTERRQLIVRAGVAGALIVALLAALLIFEGKNRDAEEKDAPSRTVLGPGTSIGDKSAPSTADSPDAPDVVRSTDAPEEQSVAPAEASAPALAPTPAPAIASAPVGIPEETADPAVGSALGVPGREPVKAAQKPAPASSPRLILRADEKPETATRAAAARTGSGFIVQVGVFTNSGNAQDIAAKLKANGIPTQVETRVNLGPFRTREEALAAQQKLAQLGLGKGMLVAPRK